MSIKHFRFNMSEEPFPCHRSCKICFFYDRNPFRPTIINRLGSGYLFFRASIITAFCRYSLNHSYIKDGVYPISFAANFTGTS